jgi:rhodanese-related sulfurtransferase
MRQFLAFFVAFMVGVGAIAGIPQPASAQNTANSADMAETIDASLENLPQGFYAIKSVDNLKSVMKEDETLLVDVRSPFEYARGHIPDAINIPLRDLAQNLDRIPRKGNVILYCTSGYRTGIGVMSLHTLGYDNIQGFASGISGWKDADEPLAFLGN